MIVQGFVYLKCGVELMNVIIAFFLTLLKQQRERPELVFEP